MENKINTSDIYLVYIKKADGVGGYGKGERDYWFEGQGSHVSGSHMCIETDEYETICTGPHKQKLFTLSGGFFSYEAPKEKVHCLKPIGVYAKYDGNCLYEMITGKEMKRFDSNNTSLNLDKYVYYDHLVLADFKKAAEELQFVNGRNDRIQQYTEKLNQHQIAAIKDMAAAVAKEVQNNNEEKTAKQYINNYKRPNR